MFKDLLGDRNIYDAVLAINIPEQTRKGILDGSITPLPSLLQAISKKSGRSYLWLLRSIMDSAIMDYPLSLDECGFQEDAILDSEFGRRALEELYSKNACSCPAYKSDPDLPGLFLSEVLLKLTAKDKILFIEHSIYKLSTQQIVKCFGLSSEEVSGAIKRIDNIVFDVAHDMRTYSPGGTGCELCDPNSTLPEVLSVLALLGLIKFKQMDLQGDFFSDKTACEEAAYILNNLWGDNYCVYTAFQLLFSGDASVEDDEGTPLIEDIDYAPAYLTTRFVAGLFSKIYSENLEPWVRLCSKFAIYKQECGPNVLFGYDESLVDYLDGRATFLIEDGYEKALNVAEILIQTIRDCAENGYLYDNHESSGKDFVSVRCQTCPFYSL